MTITQEDLALWFERFELDSTVPSGICWKKVLSPAAQAVLNACNDAVERLPLSSEPELFSIVLIAAAIRESVNQKKKRKVLETLGVPMAYSKEYCLAEDLLAIVTELEALPND